MELLYWIDRTLTRLLQAFSRMLEKRLRMTIKTQDEITFFGSLFLANHIFIGRSDPIGVFIIFLVCLVPALYAFMLVQAFVSLVLLSLHKFFDAEGALSEDKLYPKGYIAWTHIVVGSGCIAVTLLHPAMLILYLMGFIGVECLGNGAYIAFVERKKGNSQKKRKFVTEAMAALLEKCREWLPSPHPAIG